MVEKYALPVPPPAGAQAEEHHQQDGQHIQRQGQKGHAGQVLGVLQVVLRALGKLIRHGLGVGHAVFHRQHTGEDPAVQSLIVIPAASVEKPAVLVGHGFLLRKEEQRAPVALDDMQLIIVHLLIPGLVVVLMPAVVALQFQGIGQDPVDGPLHRLAAGQIAVHRLAGGVVHQTETEIGLFRGERLLQSLQPLLVQIGQGAVPGAVLHQPGQLPYLGEAVIQVGVAIAALVIPRSGPNIVPLAQGEQAGPEAACPQHKGQDHG